MSAPQIVWLRRDLRLKDQPALHAAAQAGPIVPVFVLDDERPRGEDDRTYGGAHRWWLHHSLEDLGKSFGRHNTHIVLRRGDSVSVLQGIAEEIGAGAIHANRHYEPWWRDAEEDLHDALKDTGCELCLHDGNYLMPPGTAKTGGGDPYKIYSPFRDKMREIFPPRDELPAPDSSDLPDSLPESDDLADWDLLPTSPDWAGGFREHWSVGEDAAHERLDWWRGHVGDYDDGRNLPSVDKTSQFSPHLHWGEISPVTIWHALKDLRSDGWKTFEEELIWRDYAQNVVMQFPDYPRDSYRDYDEQVLWRNPNRGHVIQSELEAWQQGRTGYPIVDAGMRQLWAIGWMHNRVRMIAASFLIKHLLIDWRFGERWFWDTLVDGDYASNGTNWQWVAGTGVDSNMFPRIMAPLSQSEKFDAAGYIREWVPELTDLSDEDIHDPPEDKRPDDYPEKLIGHKEARERALQAYRDSKD